MPREARKSTSKAATRKETKVSSKLARLMEGLNEDLAAEYQAVIMYRTYASQVGGPYRIELRGFFEGEIPDELGHAAFLADKIVSLGGVPTTVAAPVPGASSAFEMLQNALRAEEETIARYSKRIDEAEEAGELAIKVELEDLVVGETRHRDDIRRILAGWRE